mgnify:CR=1 FL=1
MKKNVLVMALLFCTFALQAAGDLNKSKEAKLKAFYAPVYTDRPWHVGLVYNSYFLNKSGAKPEMTEKLEQFKPMYSDMFGLRIARAPIDWGVGIQTGVYYHRHSYFSSIEGNFNGTAYGKMVKTYNVNYLNIPFNLLFGPNDGDVYVYFKIGASMDYFMDVTNDGTFWGSVTQLDYDTYTKVSSSGYNDFEQMRWNVNCGLGFSAHFGSDQQFGFILEPNFIKSVTNDSKIFYSEYKPLMIGITTGFQYNFRARRSGGGSTISDF